MALSKFPKKIYLDNRVIQERRTTSTSGAGLGNYAVDMGSWIEKQVEDGLINLPGIGVDSYVSAASLSGSTLTLTVANGSNVSVDLSAIAGDEVIENAGALAGAAPTGAQVGVDTTTGDLYYVSGGIWTLVPTSTVDLKATVSDETGANGTGLTVPTTAPAGTPEIGDLHIEIYDDVTLYFTAVAADWTAPTVVESPLGSVANITEGTLNVATADRTVDLGGNDLTVSNSGEVVINGITTNEIVSGVIGGAYSQLKTTAGYAEISTNGASAFSSVGSNSLGQATLYSTNSQYRIGINSTTRPPIFSDTTAPLQLSVNDTGDVAVTDSSRVFITDTALVSFAALTTAGNPTLAEIQAYVDGLFPTTLAAFKNRVLYYTGTDTSTDSYTHAYYLAGDGVVTMLDNATSVAANITGGALANATAARTVPMNGQDLTIDVINDFATNSTNSTLLTNQTGIVTSRVILNSGAATLQSQGTGQATIAAQESGNVVLTTTTNQYYIGDSAATTPLDLDTSTTSNRKKKLSIDTVTGSVYTLDDTFYFLGDTVLTGAVTLTTAGNPTSAEIESYITSLGSATLWNDLRGRFIRYTGTDTTGDETTHLFYSNDLLDVETIKEPVANIKTKYQSTFTAVQFVANVLTVSPATHGLEYTANDLLHVTVFDSSRNIVTIQTNVATDGTVTVTDTGGGFTGNILITTV